MDQWLDTRKKFHPIEWTLPLVHMTDSWEKLELILKEGLKPSYCLEELTNGKVTKSAAFPMISLSNIEISDAMNFQNSYGTFGIALSTSWGQKNDFNPVLYLEQQSNLTSEVIESFQLMQEFSVRELNSSLKGTLVGHRHLLAKSIIKYFAHSKNYDGKLVRKKQLICDTFSFGLEREWRKIISEEHIQYFLMNEELENKEHFNLSLSKIRCDFSLEDIKCIIVENEYEQKKVREILLNKYKVSYLPLDFEIKINYSRYVPDEG